MNLGSENIHGSSFNADTGKNTELKAGRIAITENQINGYVDHETIEDLESGDASVTGIDYDIVVSENKSKTQAHYVRFSINDDIDYAVGSVDYNLTNVLYTIESGAIIRKNSGDGINFYFYEKNVKPFDKNRANVKAKINANATNANNTMTTNTSNKSGIYISKTVKKFMNGEIAIDEMANSIEKKYSPLVYFIYQSARVRINYNTIISQIKAHSLNKDAINLNFDFLNFNIPNEKLTIISKIVDLIENIHEINSNNTNTNIFMENERVISAIKKLVKYVDIHIILKNSKIFKDENGLIRFCEKIRKMK